MNILHINADQIEDIEQMGSKQKFWFLLDGKRWLFKYPRPESGEHWAEVLAANVANLLSIPAAEVLFAEFEGTKGSASRSFADKAMNQLLIHGNEILPDVVHKYERDKRHRQREHTVTNIVAALSKMFKAVPDNYAAKQQMAGYLTLDAVIGNTDRHHENWAVILTLLPEAKFRLEVAPTFDHASSLGRELSDQKRSDILAAGTVGKYIERGRGGIYWSPRDEKAMCPLELCLKVAEVTPDLFRDWFARVTRLNMADVSKAIALYPAGWVSASSIKFAAEMIEHAKCRISEAKL